MGKLAVLVATIAVVAVLVPIVAIVAIFGFGLGSVTHPERCKETGSHPDEQPDEPLRDRSDPTERKPAGAVGTLDVLDHVTDHVGDLL
jgi:hypothetical protein